MQAQWAARQTGAAFPLPNYRLASSHGFVEARLCGLGWAINPEGLVAPHLAKDTLVNLSPQDPVHIQLYWRFNRLAPFAMAPLTAALQKAAKAL